MKFTKYITLIFVMILFITCSKEQAVPVITDFDITIVNNDFSVPVQVVIINKTNGADEYEWNFEGGSPAFSSDRNPGAILYNQKGEYTLKLNAKNQDDSEDSKEIIINIDDPVLIDFDLEVIESNFSPVEVSLKNNTEGATSYEWTFEGGTPLGSNEKDPRKVVFSTPGEHTIKLIVKNGRETHELEKTVFVEDYLAVGFDWEVAFKDDDYQAPVSIQLKNETTSVTSYNWSFENGIPGTSTEENPQVVFNEIGKQQITLTASNGKITETIIKNIDVFSNTNLRTFENVKFGINSAHNSNVLGSFFSTNTRKMYNKDEVDDEVGPEIDIVFFGLNNDFSFSRFLSPNNLTGASFNEIPGATKTKVINSLEKCECSSSMTPLEFDSMVDDTLLDALFLEETNDGSLSFDSSLNPRIVLFENSQGIKGAIKIKAFVDDGQSSYILTDIKVQKESN